MSKIVEFLQFISSPEIQQFIFDNENLETSQLLLNPPKFLKGYEKEIANQLISRKKAKCKIPKWFNTKGIAYPPPLSLEQSSSQIAADYKASLIQGEILYDLTGGMGIDFLSLSSQFEKATYVERQVDLCDVFRHNLKVLGNTRRNVINEGAESFIESLDEKKATFFLDPSRRDLNQKCVFRFEDCSPDLTRLQNQLLPRAKHILVKASPMMDLKQALTQLRFVKSVHIVSIKNECKELLFLIKPEYTGTVKIICVNLEAGQPEYSFSLEDEHNSSSQFGSVDKIVLDPNASILKAGAFKSIGEAFGLKKLAQNTHLYTSPKKIRDFPGRQFRVLNSDLKKGEIKTLIPSGRVNVIMKNYALSSFSVKQKYNLKDGGDLYLIGFKNEHNRPQLMLCQLA
jgi:16S rRNA G966 N2-methylase RsmD